MSLTTVESLVAEKFMELRVANGTPVKSLATSILRYFEEGQRVALSCIGAQSAAQALKAVAVANGELVAQGKYFAIVPTFDTKTMTDRHDGREIELTSIRLIIGRIPIMF